MSGDNTTTASNNEGMKAMAQATTMAAMFQSNAMVASAGLNAATQMFQANIMYMVQHEKTEAKVEMHSKEMNLREYEIQNRHNEKVRELYLEYLRIKKEDGGEVNLDDASTYYNAGGTIDPPASNSNWSPSAPADTGLNTALGTVENIAEEGTSDPGELPPTINNYDIDITIEEDDDDQ